MTEVPNITVLGFKLFVSGNAQIAKAVGDAMKAERARHAAVEFAYDQSRVESMRAIADVFNRGAMSINEAREQLMERMGE